ncbi:MAG: Ig-like domain-containing protein [Planctomycetes bacterium]|nr:Ig-like domain-containing protein [Planctomycetota bacterium]
MNTKFRPEVVAALGVAALALAAAPLVLLPKAPPAQTASVAAGAATRAEGQRVELQCPDVMHRLDPLEATASSARETPVWSAHDGAADPAARAPRGATPTGGAAARHPSAGLTPLDPTGLDDLLGELDGANAASPQLAAPKSPGAPKVRPRPRDGSVTTSGSGQVGAPGQPLAQPLVVTLLDAQGAPRPGVTVDFYVRRGGGTLSADQAVSDAAGQASTRLTLGPDEGQTTVQFRVERSRGTFSVEAVANPAPTLSVFSGDAQSALAGMPLKDPVVVQLLDAQGAPLPNVDVSFVVAAGGGQVNPATVATDAQGYAQAQWTLGAAPGDNALGASAVGAGAVTFTAKGLPATPTAAALEKTSGDAQQAVAGTKLAKPLIVTARTAAGAPVANVPVVFAVASGGGQLSLTQTQTDAQGVAATELTLGAAAGANAVTASSPGLTPVTFSASALPAPASQIAAFSGDKQTGVVGTKLAAPLVVSVKDASGQAVAGFDVSFAVTAGGGQLSAATVKTDAQGYASVELTLGASPVANTVTATAAGLTGSPVTFGATAQPVPAGAITKLSGDQQTGAVGAKLPLPLVVALTDANGQPAANLAVSFAVTAGGGQLSASTVNTDAQGHAAVELTLGPAAGANTVTAAAPGQKGSPITFSAMGRVAAGTLAKVSGDQQTGAVGTKLAQPLVVSVVDANNQPRVGFDVAFAVTAGGGQLSASTVKTDAQGRAAVELTLGMTPGANTVTATAAGQTGSPLTFGAMAQAKTPSALVAVSGDMQTGRGGAALGSPIVVQVNDAAGAPLPGVRVAFAVTTGQGTLNPSAAMTDAQGRASTEWTLGMNVQAQSMTASVGGVTPVTFNAMALPLTYVDDVKPILTAKCIVCHAPGGVFAVRPLTNYQEVTSQISFANVAFVVPADPANSALVQKTQPGGTMNQYVTPAEAATISDWVLSGAVQTTQQVVPTTLERTSGDAQSGPVGQPLANPLVVTVKDMNGDPLAGVVVTWQVTAGGGALADAMTLTAANGQASTTWTLGVAAGTNTARATAGNLTPVTFSASGSAGYSGAPLAGSTNPLDVAALSALRANGIEPAALSSDAEFLSRVTADLVGRLPSEQEVTAFLASNDPQKRAAKIDQLLASDEFADHWVRDLIGPWLQVRPTFKETINNVETTFNFDVPMTNNLRSDMPVSQILSRLVQEQGEEGVAFWREHNDNRGHTRTDVVMEAFVGMSSKCARCHDHPLTSPLDDPRWVQDDNFGLYAFLAGSPEDARKINKSGGRFGTPVEPRFVVDGYANAPNNLPTLADTLAVRRQALAGLLSQSNAFYRGFSHRVWSEIATPLLDPNQFLKANLDGVQTPVLLDALATEFANSGTSLKTFLRLAMNSKLYQLSSERADARADRLQGRYVLRRNHSEVLEQGVHQIANRTLSANTLFRFTFGAPNRDSIGSRRDTVSLDQAFVLLNAPEAINGKIGGGSRVAQLASAVDGNQISFDDAVAELTRNGLGREPTAAELAACQQARAASANTNECLQDVAAAIGASAEFLFR